MNRKRAIWITVIQLAIALLLMGLDSKPDVHLFQKTMLAEGPHLRLAALLQEEPTVRFEPMTACCFYSQQTQLLRLIDLPAEILVGYGGCPSPWSFAGWLTEGNSSWNRSKELLIDGVFLVAIAVQWLLMGSLPLYKPSFWWTEPGVFITAAALVAVALLGVRLSEFPVFGVLLLLIGLAWIVWVGALLWKGLRAAYRALPFGAR